MNASETESPAVLALVESHRRFLAFLERRIGSRDEAEEVLQEAFVKGIERAAEIRDEERAVAWFYRLLRNALADRWQERAAERRGEELLTRELAGAAQPAPEIANQLCLCFEPLLATLKREHETILRRVDLEGMRPVEFAARNGITPNNAMVRLHRARRALRDRLKGACRTCAEHGCLDCSCKPMANQGGIRKAVGPDPSAKAERR